MSSIPHLRWKDKSLAELIELGKSLLLQSSDSAKLDIQILLAFVLNKTTSYLFTWPEKVPSDQELSQFYQLVQRRISGEPIAYIVGEKEFWSLPFEVSPSTLIPRPDTEILIEHVLALAEAEPLALPENTRLLDLGTGTGAIALSLAHEKNTWQVDAVDFSHSAVELAKRNAKKLALLHVNIFQSNWYENIPCANKYHLIVSNPPYIDELDIHLDQGDVRFEPKSALVAKQGGFADLIEIAEVARKYLINNGYIFLEHGYEQGKQVREILLDLNYKNAQTIKDYAGNDRITWAYYPH